jgi:hypothetical protein
MFDLSNSLVLFSDSRSKQRYEYTYTMEWSMVVVQMSTTFITTGCHLITVKCISSVRTLMQCSDTHIILY